MSCAISIGQNAGFFCCGWGPLFAASDCCRHLCSTSQRFRAKLLADTDSDRFPDTRLRADPQPDSYRDSQRSDQNHFHPYSESNSNSDRDSNADAIVSWPECYTNSHTHAFTRISLAAFVETPHNLFPA